MQKTSKKLRTQIRWGGGRKRKKQNKTRNRVNICGYDRRGYNEACERDERRRKKDTYKNKK